MSKRDQRERERQRERQRERDEIERRKGKGKKEKCRSESKRTTLREKNLLCMTTLESLYKILLSQDSVL
jgi:hypothetical protein